MNAHVLVSLAHLLIFLPALLYIGFMRSSIPYSVYYVILAMGIFIALYHFMKTIKKIQAGATSSVWVNILHVLAVAPLLIYIGTKKNDSRREAYELLLILAFGGVGYHLYSLILETQVYKD